MCDGLRVPVEYLDDAVIDGITKRLDRVLNRELLRQRLTEMLLGEVPSEDRVPALQAELETVRRKISRLIDVLGDGREELGTLRSTLVELERQSTAPRC